MQGIYLDGWHRPKSKKAVKEAVAAGRTVVIEATSIFGNDFGGEVVDMPQGTIAFVGPDPHSDRRFYGTITRVGDKITVK